MSTIEILAGVGLLLATFLFTYLWLELKKGVLLGPAVGALLAALLVFGSFRSVAPGHRGVYTWLGAVNMETVAGEGFTALWPGFQSLKQVDVRVTPHPFKEIEAATKELLAIKMTGKLNYHIDPARVNLVYQRVGLDFPEKVLDPALSDFIKEVTPSYNIMEILPKREEIRKRVIALLSANLERYGIIIDDIYIADIAPPEEYMLAVQRHQVAGRQVLTEEEILRQKRVQADQASVDAEGKARAAVKKAEGDAQAILLTAKAQADANKLLTQSLSREIIDWTLVQKLGEQIKVMVVPAGQGIFLSIPGQ